MYEDDYEDEENEKDPLLDSELANECRKKLVEICGGSNETIERHLRSFIESVKCSMVDTMKRYTKESVRALWVEELQRTAHEFIKIQFKVALEGVVLSEENEKYTETKVKTIILDKVKSFMSSNYNVKNDRREVINASINELIAKIVNEKVDTALDEIKKETIEKFQKDVMKKMMQGMAREIAGDKKLLALMTE